MSGIILIVDDNASQRGTLALFTKQLLGIDSLEAANGHEALSLLKSKDANSIQLVIVDLHMPKMSGIELLKILVQQYSHLPVIILTGTNNVNIAVQAMQLGAYDFLTKPLDYARFEISTRNALKMRSLEEKVIHLRHKSECNFRFESLVGHDKGLKFVVNMGRKAAASDIPVLLTGETGVGKEIFAQAIHRESLRAEKPFVAVNCGAIPENLIESTLFGHEKGSFTGASSKSLGHFREANNGTIFLDEIGELPIEAQVKLLRVLQEKEVRPVGSDNSIPIDVRIISATNRDLKENIRNGRFRDDLYFRLNVFPIHLPALMERKKDIPYLIDHFIKNFSESEGKSSMDITPEAKKFIINKDWLGNVRELENAIYRSIVMCENNILDVDDFFNLSESVFTSIDSSGKPSQENTINMFERDGKLKTMDQIEQDSIQFALNYYNENVKQASIALHIAPSTFYRKLKNKD